MHDHNTTDLLGEDRPKGQETRDRRAEGTSPGAHTHPGCVASVRTSSVALSPQLSRLANEDRVDCVHDVLGVHHSPSATARGREGEGGRGRHFRKVFFVTHKHC